MTAIFDRHAVALESFPDRLPFASRVAIVDWRLVDPRFAFTVCEGVSVRGRRALRDDLLCLLGWWRRRLLPFDVGATCVVAEGAPSSDRSSNKEDQHQQGRPKPSIATLEFASS